MIHFPLVATRHIAASVAVVILAVGVVLGGTIAEAPAAQAPMTASKFVSDTAKTTNAYRKQIKSRQVKQNACLTRYANQWARNIAAKQQMVHRSKSSLRSILRACKFKIVGENLAKGQQSGAAVTTAWRNSPPHRKNLANKRFRAYGIATYWDGDRWWTVQLMAGK